jgi:hypothetical protein
MKMRMLFLASALTLVASGAFAQGNTDACHNQYGSCMERCASRPQSLQEACSNSCESTTNACYGNMYGPRSNAVNVAPAPAGEAAEARDARDEAKPEGDKSDAAKPEAKQSKKKKH